MYFYCVLLAEPVPDECVDCEGLVLALVRAGGEDRTHGDRGGGGAVRHQTLSNFRPFFSLFLFWETLDLST